MDCQAQNVTKARESLQALRARVRAAESDEQLDTATADLDDALDALVNAPSRSVGDVATKMRALAQEYGYEWQPRHVKALLADLRVLAS